ncbi:hypothetical protein TNCV_3372101 [Trichonephila clavipes]|nr:hypothetical protein TNCV_3372101 [Trichonephila clavipes]
MHEASYLRHRRRRVTFSEERRGKTAATFDYCLLVILCELTKRKLLISLTVKGLGTLQGRIVGLYQLFPPNKVARCFCLSIGNLSPVYQRLIEFLFGGSTSNSRRKLR